MRFSQRIGIVPVRNVIQKDSMDVRLRNSLWDALDIYYWKLVSNGTSGHDHRSGYPLFPRERGFKTNKIEEIEFKGHTFNRSWTDRESKVFFEKLWIDYFKRPIDELPFSWNRIGSGRTIRQELLDYFGYPRKAGHSIT